MDHIFNGCELLLFKHFQENPKEWRLWRQKLIDLVGESGIMIDIEDVGEIPQNLWFLSVALHRRQKYVLQVVREDMKREINGLIRKPSNSLLSTYLSHHQFTELHLDSIFKYGEDNTLPKEIFKCPHVTYLSLKYNSLDHIPSDIGRMKNLQCLALTNNKLQVHSLPYTLTFCTNLKSLLLDNNLLDALPGFLMQMSSLETVHRHGNHNYFKATFMWYHTDVNYRIIQVGPLTSGTGRPYSQHSLQFMAAKTIIGQKKDFFSDAGIAMVLKDYLSEIYDMFHICHHCRSAQLKHHSGYKVITFKNPYLGNTCVPFQHWTCSLDCAKALEVPARVEQIAMSQNLDRMYEDYIITCQRDFANSHGLTKILSCTSRNSALTTHSPNQSRCLIL